MNTMKDAKVVALLDEASSFFDVVNAHIETFGDARPVMGAFRSGQDLLQEAKKEAKKRSEDKGAGTGIGGAGR